MEWAQTALLGLNLGWTTLCLGGFRPETMVVTTALTGALLTLHFAGYALGPAAPARYHFAGWCTLPFLVYAAINVLTVSPVPWLGRLEFFGWLNFLGVFWVALNAVSSAGPRRALFGLLVLLGVVAVAMGCYQRFSNPAWLMLGRTQVEQFFGRATGPFGIPNSLAAFLVLLLPATGARVFRRRATAVERVWWGWIALILTLGLLLTVSRGAWLGLATSLVLWPLLGTRGTWRRRLALTAIILGAWICAGAVLYASWPKARERLDRLVQDGGELSRPILWQAAWNLFREQPTTGTGAASYNILFERYRPHGFNGEPQWAHNDYLNTLSDYGVLGFVLLFGAGGVIAIQARGRTIERSKSKKNPFEPRLPTTALGIGLLAFACHLAVDFHLRIPALAMAFATTAGLALGAPARALADDEAGNAPSRFRRGVALCAALVLAVLMIAGAKCYRAEAFRYGARQSIDRAMANPPQDAAAVLHRAEADLRRAISLDARNAAAWSDLAFVAEMQARFEPAHAATLAVAAEHAARQALTGSTVVLDFWIRLGVALDMQARANEAHKAFARGLELAPKNSHAWYYYADHLSRGMAQGDAALRAVTTALSLEPNNEAAEALRRRLNERH